MREKASPVSGQARVFPGIPESLQHGHDLPQCGLMHRLHPALGPALNGRQNLLHQVVHVDQVELDGRVGNLNGQPSGNVVAEGGHGAVVVGAAELAEHVGQPVQVNGRTGLLAVLLKGLLRRQLAAAVGIVQGRLNGGGHQHRAGVARPLQQLYQLLGEAGVAPGKFPLILGPVHPGQVYHEAALGRVLGQNSLGSIGFGPQQLNLGQALLQRLAQIFADEPSRPGNQYLHSASPVPLVSWSWI